MCPCSFTTQLPLPALPEDPDWKGSVSLCLKVPCVIVNCRRSSFTRPQVPLGYE